MKRLYYLSNNPSILPRTSLLEILFLPLFTLSTQRVPRTRNNKQETSLNLDSWYISFITVLCIWCTRKKKRRRGASGEVFQRKLVRLFRSHPSSRLSDACRRRRRAGGRATPVDTTGRLFIAGAHAQFRRDDGQPRGLSRADPYFFRFPAE